MSMDATPGTKDGTLEEIGGRQVLRFERRLPHPVERVWDALTRPEQLGQWVGEGEFDVELVEGGRIHMRTTGPPELVDAIVAEAGEDALETDDTVLRVEPPRVYEHTFGGQPDSIVRWELHPDTDGCRLVLTHTMPPGAPPAEAPHTLAGWHALLERLGGVLDGRPGVWSRREWEELRDRYAANLDRS
jgi:uncharacterized protein YndB with AHSA1/START domain